MTKLGCGHPRRTTITVALTGGGAVCLGCAVDVARQLDSLRTLLVSPDHEVDSARYLVSANEIRGRARPASKAPAHKRASRRGGVVGRKWSPEQRRRFKATQKAKKLAAAAAE